MLAGRRATLVWIHDGGERLDRALVTLFEEGSSYTGEEMVEVSAHGSPYVLERILEMSVEAGARPAAPGEFTQRAFLSGRLDLSQAEAVCDLIAARTRLAHRAAVSRLEGGLSRETAGLRRDILELRARVEAALDHPDEGLSDDPEAASRAARGLLARVEAMGRGARRGRLLREGARVVLLGPRNAGKSSLLNALLGTDRAIVHPEPGTTRDTLEETCDLEGIQTTLIDTAGLSDWPCPVGDGTSSLDSDHRLDAGPVEKEGQLRALAAARGADLLVLVLDRTLDPETHRGVLEWTRAEARRLARPLVTALNKSDLEPARTRPEHVADVLGASFAPRTAGSGGVPAAVEVSALRRSGLEDLARAVTAGLSEGDGLPEAECSASAAGARHRRALDEAAAQLRPVPEFILSGRSPELAAERLRRAADALDEIEGHTAPEEVLSGVFSRFCVGK